MPQMSPMWWLTLMFMFLIMMILINMITYFNKNYKETTNFSNMKTENIKWKW